jgi:GT2 family glycosyltransferase
VNLQPSVAIVILNWNGKDHLAQFLPSVLATDYENISVVVADNASTDDSIAFLKKDFPSVKLVALEKNFGFASGYNQALKQVDADYYMILNSDVEVTPGWIDPLVKLLESDPAHAACQPKLLSWKQRDYFEYAGAAGGWLDLYGYPFGRGRIFDICEPDRGQYDKTAEIFWASGAALMIKSKVFHEAGGFDDYFFAHQEEIDLCWRLKLKGYKIFCCPDSVVYHLGGGTLPKGASRKTFLNFRNNQVMLAKNLAHSEKWWKIPFRLLLDQVAAWKGLFSGEVGYFVTINKAHFAFLKWWFSSRNRRKNPSIRLSGLSGVYNGNMIWQYFVKSRTKFNEIIRSDSEEFASNPKH